MFVQPTTNGAMPAGPNLISHAAPLQSEIEKLRLYIARVAMNNKSDAFMPDMSHPRVADAMQRYEAHVQKYGHEVLMNMLRSEQQKNNRDQALVKRSKEKEQQVRRFGSAVAGDPLAPYATVGKLVPLRTGCFESRFDVGGKLESGAGVSYGPMTLADCHKRCRRIRDDFFFARRAFENAHERSGWRRHFAATSAQLLTNPLAGACGAISFYEVPPPPNAVASDGKSPDGSNEPKGFCQLKAAFCTALPFRLKYGECTESVRWGRRDPLKRGWCSYLVGKVPTLKDRPPYHHRPRIIDSAHPSCPDGVEVGHTIVALPDAVLRGGAGGWFNSANSSLWKVRARGMAKSPQPVAEASNVSANAASRGGTSSSSYSGTVYLEPVSNDMIAVLGGGCVLLFTSLMQAACVP